MTDNFCKYNVWEFLFQLEWISLIWITSTDINAFNWDITTCDWMTGWRINAPWKILCFLWCLCSPQVAEAICRGQRVILPDKQTPLRLCVAHLTPTWQILMIVRGTTHMLHCAGACGFTVGWWINKQDYFFMFVSCEGGYAEIWSKPHVAALGAEAGATF